MPPDEAQETPVTPAAAATAAPADPAAAALADKASEAPAGAGAAAAADPAKATEQPKPAEGGKPEERLSKRFAIIARQERALQQEKARLKAEKAELETARGKNVSLEEELRKSPLKVLKERAGKTYADLTNEVLGETKPTPDQELQALRGEIEKLRQEQVEREDQAAKARADEAIQGFRQNISNHLKGNAEKYELTLAQENAEDIVYNVIYQHYEETKKQGAPKILSIEEASAHVESFIEKQIDERYLKLKKIQSRFAPKEPPKADPAKAPPPPAAGAEPPATLSNSLQSGAPSRTSKVLSAEESLAESAKLLKWTE